MRSCLALPRRERRFRAEQLQVVAKEATFMVTKEGRALRGRLSVSARPLCVRLGVRDGGEAATDCTAQSNQRDVDTLAVCIQGATSLRFVAGDTIVIMTYVPFRVSVYDRETCVSVFTVMEDSEDKIVFISDMKSIDALYGLAERASPSKLYHKQTYTLYNTDEFGLAQGTGKPLYGSVPFIVGVRHDRAVGFLLRNESKIVVRLKRRLWSHSSRQYWSHEVGATELVCFPGKDPISIRQNFMELCGVTPLPPLFSLGYHQCRWNYNDQKDVLEVDSNLREAGIPCDVIWLDIEHSDGKRYMTWDMDKFKPCELINTLKNNGRHLVVIIDPHIKEDPGYHIYQEAKEAGYLIRNEDGSTFIGKCWPDDSAWIDFISEEASTWWSEKICSYLKEYGCSTECNNLWIWNDMNEPSVFKCPDNQMKPTALHANGVEHKQIHNIYGQQMVIATWNGILKACNGNLRPFLLSRSFYSGSQKYGAIWTGDSLCTWDHLQVSISMMLSLSICGIDFCGADVGGFFGDPEPELLCRWYQLGAFQPFFRAHAHIDSLRREPYLLKEPYKTVVRNTVCLRYKLLSYWYLCFWKAETEFVPVVCPVWMTFDKYQSHKGDETYMVGNNILVRPIVSPSCVSFTIILPGTLNNVWYQYCHVSFCWKIRKSKQSLKIPVNLDSIPVFYIAGSCIFMKDGNCANTVEWKQTPYHIFLFPDALGKSSGLLYIDDYVSFKYKKENEYSLLRCSFSSQDDTICMTCLHVNKSKDPSSSVNISAITIIKNDDYFNSKWKHILIDKSDENEGLITQFNDRLEITNLHLDLDVSWIMKLD